jgi:Ca2+-binding EF-hand superfamily protein
MQQKFTIDKQEYQSVFRVIDKDNQGFITVDQVNHYIEQFE